MGLENRIVYDIVDVVEGTCKLKQAFEKYWDNYIIGYSYKTNSLPWVVDYFYKAGCYAEVVSEHEYKLGQYMNIRPEHFIYNGPIKTQQSMIDALINDAYVNLDAWREIDWLDQLPKDRHYNLGIRVNYDIEQVCLGQSSGGSEGGRFGFCYENGELKRAIDTILDKGLKIAGLHLHNSSKTRSIDIYKASAIKACEIVNRYGLELEFVDIGGGFFGGLSNKPQFDDYLSVIFAELSKYFDSQKTKLILEPGMALIGSPISYVTSVIDVKDTTYGRFVVTDGSRTQIDPLMRKTNYFYSIEQKENKLSFGKQIVSGYTCMENDRIFIAENKPELQVGDLITYEKVGAYTMCLTPLFIKYFPAVYVDDKNGMTLVRREWEPYDYASGSFIGGEEL